MGTHCLGSITAEKDLGIIITTNWIRVRNIMLLWKAKINATTKKKNHVSPGYINSNVNCVKELFPFKCIRYLRGFMKSTVGTVLWQTGSHVGDGQQQKENQVTQPSEEWKLEKKLNLFSLEKRKLMENITTPKYNLKRRMCWVVLSVHWMWNKK